MPKYENTYFSFTKRHNIACKYFNLVRKIVYFIELHKKLQRFLYLKKRQLHKFWFKCNVHLIALNPSDKVFINCHLNRCLSTYLLQKKSVWLRLIASRISLYVSLTFCLVSVASVQSVEAHFYLAAIFYLFSLLTLSHFAIRASCGLWFPVGLKHFLLSLTRADSKKDCRRFCMINWVDQQVHEWLEEGNAIISILFFRL